MSDLKFKTFPSNRVTSLLEKASKLAETSTNTYRLAAIIVKNGTEVGSGINKSLNSGYIENPDYRTSIHAEVAALNNCRKVDLNGATIFVARVLKDGSQAMSKPCADCQKQLKARGIKKVYYTIDSEMDL